MRGRRPRSVLLLALLIVTAGTLGLRAATPRAASAAINQPTKQCTPTQTGDKVVVGDVVNCTLTITAASIADLPDGTIITTTPTSGNYSLTVNNGTCLPAGCTAFAYSSSVLIDCTGVGCGATQVTIPETLAIISAVPASIVQTIAVFLPGNPTPVIFTVQANVTIIQSAGPPGRTFYAAPEGEVPAPVIPPSATATSCPIDKPCTLGRAIDLARDADTVMLLPGQFGRYRIARTVLIDELLTIQANTGDKVVLAADPGITMFEVRAQGSPILHATIRDFTMGGNYKDKSTAPVILLTNDNYTEIANNIIGAQDLPINNGIVLSNSDHANLHDNTVQGSNRLTFTPILEIGRNLNGFGVVTVECFGNTPAGVSDGVTIYRNLFNNQLIAGVWLCSDGAGKHEIRENTFRGNWRGIALKDVANTLVASNVLTDDRSDGIILYGASLRNVVDRNRVESHITGAAAGIRIGWIADPIMPLSNSITGNNLIRDTVGIHVFGARTTVIQNNELKISGNRTAILITPSTTPLDPGTQPFDTEITGNVIVFIGPCAQALGCGIRLVGTTVPVLATDNDWGLRRINDVEGVIWHQRDDPLLGQVVFQPFRSQLTSTPTPSVTPNPLATAIPAITPTPTNGSGNGGAPITTLTLEPGCVPLAWPGASGMSVVDAIMTIQPAEAQQTAVIWRRDRDGWKAWGPGLRSGAPRNVFTIERGDILTVCVEVRASWSIPTQLGGP